MPSHVHGTDYVYYQVNFGTIPFSANLPAAGALTPSQSGIANSNSKQAGSDWAHNNIQPTRAALLVIKT